LPPRFEAISDATSSGVADSDDRRGALYETPELLSLASVLLQCGLSTAILNRARIH
jgi:hypothetical protein